MDLFLKHVKIFSTLSQKELSAVTPLFFQKSYKRNETIFSEEDEGDDFYIIESGAVKVCKLNRDGRELTIAILSKYDTFGELSIFDRRRRSATLIAIRDCKFQILKRDSLLQAIKTNPEIAMKMLTLLSERIVSSNGNLESLAFGSLKERCEKLLLKLAIQDCRGSKNIELPYSQHELADLLGASRESLTRVLKEMQLSGKIKTGNRKLYILDIENLGKEL